MDSEERELIEKVQAMKDELSASSREIERLNSVIDAGDKVLNGRQKRVIELKVALESERQDNLRLVAEIVELNRQIRSQKISLDAASTLMARS
ncbi:hypothetical protein LCGC14_2162280 [marine sediment metagenome]|uniref:Uncharacterized protein n=1 Tax=marine sediment metagenome TaxID=412755 RepID=A0A0F9DSB1_9ZZZZ